jgi:inositol 2-dehydrogenase
MVKVCVVGMGRAGKIHAENFLNKVNGARLATIVDPIEQVAKKASQEFGVPSYLDLKEALEKESIDALILCTPSFTHPKLIIEGVNQGKNILCEKPLALGLKEAEEAIKAVEKAKVKLQVGYMRHFDRYYTEVKKRIGAGEIGKPLVFKSTARDPSLPSGWTADPRLSGGIFLDMLSHDFDTARWLMGKKIKRVYAQGGAWIYEESKRKGDFDTVGVILEFEGGIGLIEGCRKCTYGYDLRTEIKGTEGTLVVGSPYDANLMIGKSQGILYGKAEWFWGRFKDAFFQEDIHFVNCIKANKEPLVGGLDGKRALEIALAARKSIKEGKPINLRSD